MAFIKGFNPDIMAVLPLLKAIQPPRAHLGPPSLCRARPVQFDDGCLEPPIAVGFSAKVNLANATVCEINDICTATLPMIINCRQVQNE